MACRIAACLAAAWLTAASAAAQTAGPPLDPLQQAVVDSLAFPTRTTAPDLLDAALRAADVEALDVARDYFKKLGGVIAAAGDGRPDLLADLGDAFSAADLARLERQLASREPAVRDIVAAIGEAARLRRRDPARLARAAADLASDSAATRAAAADALARAGTDALPAIVAVLGSRPPDDRAALLAASVVRELGPTATQPLVAWLGSDDVAGWPGASRALAATGATDATDFLLAPALVADVPPPARDAARRALIDLGAGIPEPAAAIDRLAARLDRVLSPAGLPEVDHLLLEPIADPAGAAAAFGGAVTGTVDRFMWDPRARRPAATALPPRAARADDALHLARDLVALGGRDPASVRLVLLARLEALLVASRDAAPEPAAARAAVSGPEGFDPGVAADVLELAVTRGLWEAAAAAAAALEPPDAAAPDPEPLQPAVRTALVRALAVPDAAVQFAAARTLALAAGDPPWPGSSRMVEVLRHAATATGLDRVVVAHPDAAIAHELAADVSRFGYEPVRVSTGRDCILAARESADTVLVLLAARTVQPSARETVQFLGQQGLGGPPPVLVIVDPLDDDGRGGFLQKLILAFCDTSGIAIVDRLDSLFEPALDPESGAVRTAPRFPDVLAQAAGPAAVDPASRAAARDLRRTRARAALGLLARLGRRGHDVSAALDTARLALVGPDLQAPALSLLATIGRPAAQEALVQEAERTDLPPAARQVALAALAVSVERYGVLVSGREVLALATRYTRTDDAAVRAASGSILEVIGTRRRSPPPVPRDAPPARPTR